MLETSQWWTQNDILTKQTHVPEGLRRHTPAVPLPITSALGCSTVPFGQHEALPQASIASDIEPSALARACRPVVAIGGARQHSFNTDRGAAHTPQARGPSTLGVPSDLMTNIAQGVVWSGALGWPGSHTAANSGWCTSAADRGPATVNADALPGCLQGPGTSGPMTTFCAPGGSAPAPDTYPPSHGPWAAECGTAQPASPLGVCAAQEQAADRGGPVAHDAWSGHQWLQAVHAEQHPQYGLQHHQLHSRHQLESATGLGQPSKEPQLHHNRPAQLRLMQQMLQQPHPQQQDQGLSSAPSYQPQRQQQPSPMGFAPQRWSPLPVCQDAPEIRQAAASHGLIQGGPGPSSHQQYLHHQHQAAAARATTMQRPVSAPHTRPCASHASPLEPLSQTPPPNPQIPSPCQAPPPSSQQQQHPVGNPSALTASRGPAGPPAGRPGSLTSILPGLAAQIGHLATAASGGNPLGGGAPVPGQTARRASPATAAEQQRAWDATRAATGGSSLQTERVSRQPSLHRQEQLVLQGAQGPWQAEPSVGPGCERQQEVLQPQQPQQDYRHQAVESQRDTKPRRHTDCLQQQQQQQQLYVVHFHNHGAQERLQPHPQPQSGGQSRAGTGQQVLLQGPLLPLFRRPETDSLLGLPAGPGPEERVGPAAASVGGSAAAMAEWGRWSSDPSAVTQGQFGALVPGGNGGFAPSQQQHSNVQHQQQLRQLGVSSPPQQGCEQQHHVGTGPALPRSGWWPTPELLPVPQQPPVLTSQQQPPQHHHQPDVGEQLLLDQQQHERLLQVQQQARHHHRQAQKQRPAQRQCHEVRQPQYSEIQQQRLLAEQQQQQRQDHYRKLLQQRQRELQEKQEQQQRYLQQQLHQQLQLQLRQPQQQQQPRPLSAQPEACALGNQKQEQQERQQQERSDQGCPSLAATTWPHDRTSWPGEARAPSGGSHVTSGSGMLIADAGGSSASTLPAPPASTNTVGVDCAPAPLHPGADSGALLRHQSSPHTASPAQSGLHPAASAPAPQAREVLAAAGPALSGSSNKDGVLVSWLRSAAAAAAASATQQQQWHAGLPPPPKRCKLQGPDAFAGVAPAGTTGPLADGGAAAAAAAMQAVDKLIALAAPVPQAGLLALAWRQQEQQHQRQQQQGMPVQLGLAPAVGYESDSETGSDSITAAAMRSAGWLLPPPPPQQHRHQQQAQQLLELFQRRRQQQRLSEENLMPGWRGEGGSGSGSGSADPVAGASAAAAAAVGPGPRSDEDSSAVECTPPPPPVLPPASRAVPPHTQLGVTAPVASGAKAAAAAAKQPAARAVRQRRKAPQASPALATTVGVETAAGMAPAAEQEEEVEGSARSRGLDMSQLGKNRPKPPPVINPIRPGYRQAAQGYPLGRAVGEPTCGVRLKRGEGAVGGGQWSGRAAAGDLLNKMREARALMKSRFVVRRSRIAQMGVFTTVTIPPQTLLMEYHGEAIRSSVADIREKRYSAAGLACYLFNPGGPAGEAVVLDATHRGNIMRFANHSCDPNCVSRTTVVDGQRRIFLYSVRELPAGTELTYDYKLSSELCLDKFKGLPEEAIERAAEEIGVKLMVCQCGARNCRKYL